jgi:hypothetical protein
VWIIPQTSRRQFQTEFRDRARHQDSECGADRKGKCTAVEISRNPLPRFKDTEEEDLLPVKTVRHSLWLLFSKQHQNILNLRTN